MRECITHHNACDCREAKYTMEMAILKAENEALLEVARAAQKCIPPEAYYPKNEGTAVADLAKALDRLDELKDVKETTCDLEKHIASANLADRVVLRKMFYGLNEEGRKFLAKLRDKPE